MTIRSWGAAVAACGLMMAGCANNGGSTTSTPPGSSGTTTASSGTAGGSSAAGTSSGVIPTSSSGFFPSSSDGPMCDEDGDTCAAADQCCSNRCSMVTQTCGGCFHKGVACGNSSECCGQTSCNSEGRCGCYSYGETCSQNFSDNCCWGFCGSNNQCTCRGVGEMAGEFGDGRQCCSGVTNNNGQCACNDGQDSFYNRCLTDTDCCNGFCDLTQQNNDRPGGFCRLRDLGGACDAPTDCYSGDCANGTCQCRSILESCTGSGACCTGLTCDFDGGDGVCRAETDGPCAQTTDCASSSNICQDGTCCPGVGAYCFESLPCCGGLTCVDGANGLGECTAVTPSSSGPSATSQGATSSATSSAPPSSSAGATSSATSMAAPSSSGIPGGWICNEEYYNDADGYCDCGCGATDANCTGGSCTEPGCNVQGCDWCYNNDNGVICPDL